MSEEQSRWVGLSDCSWMNIVNHANCYAFHDKEEAVEMAVKLTEAKLKSLNDVARPCPRCAEIAALTTKVAELTQDLQTTSDALGHADSNDRELIEEQLGTIKALNIALGGEDSTSTENLIDANEVDFDENGLIALCRKLIAENVQLNDVVIFQKSGWTVDYDKLTRAESVIEKCNLALELNVPLLTTRLAAIFAIAAYREGK